MNVLNPIVCLLREDVTSVTKIKNLDRKIGIILISTTDNCIYQAKKNVFGNIILLYRFSIFIKDDTYIPIIPYKSKRDMHKYIRINLKQKFKIRKTNIKWVKKYKQFGHIDIYIVYVSKQQLQINPIDLNLSQIRKKEEFYWYTNNHRIELDTEKKPLKLICGAREFYPEKNKESNIYICSNSLKKVIISIQNIYNFLSEYYYKEEEIMEI